MILAAPLVIPFAEAIGLSVAVLGMAKIGDEVNKYIKSNPEESAMILKTLVPNLGIGEIFMKKDSGDEEVSEDIDVEVEEKPKKLSGKEKGMRIKEAIRRARAGRGNYSSPDAEGSAVDIRGSVIREVEDMGIADKDLKDNYDPDKPKFDYEKFFKRRRRADGGAIGIEVLFEPKVPAAPSQLVSESDILLGYRGDAAYRSGSEQSKSIGQGNVGSKASFGGGQGRDRSGRSEGAGGADRSRITQQQTRNQNANNFLNKIKKANPPGQSPFQKFLAHDRFTDLLKESKIGNYHQLGGFDFMARFPDINPDVAKGLASAYQNLFEYGRAVADGPGGITFDDAGKKAAEESRLNAVGIDSFFDPNSKTYKTYSEGLIPEIMGNVQMADGGRVGLFMGGSPLEGQALSIYNSMNAYGFDDQAIADALSAQGLYTAPGSSTPETTPGNTIGYQGVGGGGGDNFSVYNPDPNSIRSIKQDPAIQSNLEAIQRNQQLQSMGIKDPFANEQDPANAYYGDMFEDTSNQIGKQSMFAKAKQGLSGIVGDVKGLMNSPIGNAIGFAINPIMGGIKGIASFANRMLPANERAIQENIMGNMGFAVNDIGQIVSTGDYDDPENVMAGYNLSRMTPETFMKRIASIKNRKAAQTDASRRRIAAIQEAQRKFEAAEKLKRLAVEEANLRKGRAPGGGRFDGGQAAYTNPDTGVGGGQFTDSLGNQDYQDAYDPGGGEKDGGIIGYQKGGLATMFKEKR